MHDFDWLVGRVHWAHSIARAHGTAESIAEADERRKDAREVMYLLRSSVSDMRFLEMQQTLDTLKDTRDLIEREYVIGSRHQ